MMAPSAPRLSLASSPNVAPGELFMAIMPWLAVLVAFVIVGWILLSIIRRTSRNTDSLLNDGFTLGQLRKMHARGELTSEEYEQARSIILGHHGSPADISPGAAGSDTPMESENPDANDQ
ncbi:MAG: hypothetical protein CMJ24_03930 [Phycisphaerae bacterium]|nr:hypothetical protein [Phycisphaerae bacterium]